MADESKIENRKSKIKLTRPSDVRTILDGLGFVPSRALGQNFLVDENILRLLLDFARLEPDDQALEIGAGLGVLTERLAPAVRRVVAVEKDRRLEPWLRSRLDRFPNVELIIADMMRVDHEALLRSGVNKVVANLPYSVGSAILVNLMTAAARPPAIVVTLQHEVALRLAAVPGSADFGLLGLWAQLDYEVAIRKKVSATCFFPPPNVQSAIVSLTRRSPAVEPLDRAFFYALTKQAFSQRRKQMKSVFERGPALTRFPAERIQAALQALSLDARSRAEDVQVEAWCRLANALSEHAQKSRSSSEAPRASP